MDCSAVRQKIADYFEGTLPLDERKQLEDHLAVCEQCRSHASDITKTIAALKGLEEVPPPPWLTRKVMERIRTEAQPKKGIFQKLFFPLHIKLPIEAAATLLIAGAAVLIMKSMGPDLQQVAIVQEKPLIRTAPPEKEPLPKSKQAISPPEQKAGEAPAPEVRSKSEVSSSQPRMAEQQPVPTAPAPPASAVPAPVMRGLEAGKTRDVAEPAKEERMTDAEAARPLRFAEKKAPEMPEITLQVMDMDKANQEIRNILSTLGGIIKTADKRESRITLTIELLPS
ncbi:MAG: DUF2275 domain-containing protein, partial [Nitrospirae bacterium]|nr:DUF2275 domain-containing protein [Nitrospirota bacterium]